MLNLHQPPQHRLTCLRNDHAELWGEEELGLPVGLVLGRDVGVLDGDELGLLVGLSVGAADGDEEGVAEGSWLGLSVGTSLG